MTATSPACELLYCPERLPTPAFSVDVDRLLGQITPALEKSLNEKQREAFRRSFEDRASVVWGPPGTGKTAVVVAVVLGWLEHAAESGTPRCIGIGSNTWDAIDLVLGKIDAAVGERAQLSGRNLRTWVDLVRLRGDYSAPPKGSDESPPGRDVRIRDVRRGSQEGNALAESMIALNDHSLVVGGTWLQLSKLASKHSPERSARDVGVPSARWFDLLILDEASQIKVTAAAGYYLLLKESGHLVLAGDNKQLGPIFTFPVFDTQQGLLESVFSYMRERHSSVPSTQLVDNYRTNDEIAAWPKQRFYTEYRAIFPDRRLDIAPPVARPTQWPDGLEWTGRWSEILDPALPVAVVTYPAQPYTLANPFEAHAMAALAVLYRLCLPVEREPATFWKEGLAVVTPHRAQVAAVRNLLRLYAPLFAGTNPTLADPMVNTVDSIQGDQRQMVLASYSVADKDFVASEEDFLMDPRRFNVTLTRAKAKFVLFISESLLRHLPSELESAERAAHLQLFVAEYCEPIGQPFDLPFVEAGTPKLMAGCRLRGRRAV